MNKKYFLIKVVFIIFICLNYSFLIAQENQGCPDSCSAFINPRRYPRERAKECIVRYIECTWDFNAATTIYVNEFRRRYRGTQDTKNDIEHIQSLISEIQRRTIYRDFQILKSSISILNNEIKKMKEEDVELRKKIINLQALSEEERSRIKKLEMDINNMIGNLFSSNSPNPSGVPDSQIRIIFNYGKEQVKLEFEGILNTLKDLQSLSTTTATNEQIRFMIDTLNDKFCDLKDKWVRISSSSIVNVVFSNNEKSNINHLVNQIDVLISSFTSRGNIEEATEPSKIYPSGKEKNPTIPGDIEGTSKGRGDIENVSKKIATLILIAMVFLLSFLLIKIVFNRERKFFSQNKDLKK
jgi:hypothetical protein